MMLDMVNNVKVEKALEPVARTADVQGESIDLVEAIACMFDVMVGAPGITLDDTNKIELRIQDSDDGVSFADIPAEDYLQGVAVEGLQLNAPALADRAHKLGYRGIKRYARLAVVYTGTHGAATVVGASAITKVKAMPVAN